MEYLILFLEGMITFISPCLLPMIPIYISFFAGQGVEGKKQRALLHSLGFVFGFTVVFVMLGAFAGTFGKALKEYAAVVNLVTGGIVILLGLNFIEIIRIPFFNRSRQISFHAGQIGFFRSVLFGIVFSIGWTPCVGAFLGSTLMFAASRGESGKGILMLLSFSIGLGIPFVASALLIDQMKKSFDFIKLHYQMINYISGGFLIIVGILMATGRMGYLLSLLTF